MSQIGVVVIGRNEGERLERCFRAVAGGAPTIVYVDSGSSDDSVSIAQAAGIAVVELDRSIPFTAARARNEGFARLMEVAPDVDYVQFVDGDCEIVEGWLEAAARRLDEAPHVAVVCGRLRERHPDASLYNRLCDMEWNGPVGEIAACGGLSMIRCRCFRDADGFHAQMIAGEEAELCARIRFRGGAIERLPVEMALHDADMRTFGQWWRRTVRSGHAGIESLARYGSLPERRRVLSIVIWAVAVPLLSIAAALLTAWPAIMAWPVIYLAQTCRITYCRHARFGSQWSHARLYALFITLAKFAELFGIARWCAYRVMGRQSLIIEHRRPIASVPQPMFRETDDGGAAAAKSA